MGLKLKHYGIYFWRPSASKEEMTNPLEIAKFVNVLFASIKKDKFAEIRSVLSRVRF